MDTEPLRKLLIEAARRQRPIYYQQIAPLYDFDYDREHDRAEVGRLLGDLSESEVAMGRPMLSAVAVHKGGDEMPGPGFFDLAKKLSRFRGGDAKIFWAMELKAVHEYWACHEA